MTDFFETLTACDPEPITAADKAADKAAFQDLLIYGQGAVLVKPDGTREHVPPAHIPRARTHLPACNVNVLALDLATKCGWAYRTRDGKQRSGVERFAPGKGGHNGQRWLAMRQWLTEAAREMGGVHVVYFEDVKRHVSNLSARAYCGYLAILEAWCATNNVPMVGVGVGTIKKAFTGKGNATKEDMIAEAKRRGMKVIDDNEADALAILAYGVQQEA